MERVGDAIPTTAPHFLLRPTQKCHCRHGPTSTDVGNPRCRQRNRKWKPKVEVIMNEKSWRFQRLIPYFRLCQTQIWHCRHCPRSTDIRISKCRRKPEVILTSGCPPMSDRVGQCRCCLKGVGVTGKGGVKGSFQGHELENSHSR